MYNIWYIYDFGDVSLTSSTSSTGYVESLPLQIHDSWLPNPPSGYTFSKVRIQAEVSTKSGYSCGQLCFGRHNTNDYIITAPTNNISTLYFEGSDYDGSTTSGANRYKFSNNSQFALALRVTAGRAIIVTNLVFCIMYESETTPNNNSVFPGEVILSRLRTDVQTGDQIYHIPDIFQQHSLITADDWNNSIYGTELRLARNSDGTFTPYSFWS